MKQIFFYTGHLHSKYLALTIMEAGISREDGYKMLWLVDASGVLWSFADNLGTILSLRDRRN